MTKNPKLLWLLALTVLLCLGFVKPKLHLPVTKGKRIVSRLKASAGQLMQRKPNLVVASVTTPTTGYLLPLRFPAGKTNAIFGWAVEGSTNMRDWYTVLYPITEDQPTVYVTKSKEFFRVVGRN